MFRLPERRSLIWLGAAALFFERYESGLGDAPPPSSGRTSRLYVVGLNVFGFMIVAGTLGAACFVGAAIAEGLS